MLRSCLVSLFLTAAVPVVADVPRVVVDIAPVHSLVAQVMIGVGEPELIVHPGASPHSYAMRPSEARAMEQADLVVWMGPQLTPWFEKPLEALGASARHVTLLDLAATETLPLRVLDHDDGEQEDEHHGHDHGHGHEGVDPHAWLDPRNGQAWLATLAEELAAIDPENAGTYRANAVAAVERLEVSIAEITSAVQPMDGRSFIAFHDAYQYFERRFSLTLAGTVSLSDARSPSPARLARLREEIGQKDIACAFSEPQFNTGVLQTVIEGTDTRILVLDPIGAHLTPGPDLYAQLLRDMGAGFVECAGN
ncbi:zinc ABC transporter substrate-binding protein [Ruegeria marina]|uniref:High-affinity zinc uptake system protein ZnuA n=1 Tax=Ruegeria marina TaxID=639004 RepID=A0A1G6RZ03_9RHOB|nr:zinc ABC transporter substrate-binding protein [Ruegeria marina]SDD09653.1 zinc transport system substrate-binding protein [Ruegeria marina]